jgi:hypothetical protein
LFVPLVAFAIGEYEEGYRWKVDGGSTWYATGQEAVDAGREAMLVAMQTNNCSPYGLTARQADFGPIVWTSSPWYARAEHKQTCDGYPYAALNTVNVNIERAGCTIGVNCPAPPAPECGDGTKGRLQPTRAASATAVTTIIGGCLDGCAVSGVRVDPIGINKDVDGTFYFLPWVKFSGETCSGGVPEIPPDDPEPVPEPTGEVCKESTEGTEVCGAPAYGENCGYVNGNFTCLGKTDPDECWVNPDGSRICGESGPTPPVPDDQLGANGPSGSGNTYNYYNSGTVAGSSRDAGDSGANPNRPNSTDPRTAPTPVVDVGGDGDGYGEESEDPGEIAGYEACEGEACPTFQGILGGYYEQLQEVAIVSAWTNIGASIPAGSCPDASVSVFGDSYDVMTIPCQIWDNTVSPLLGLVFLFVWPFLGLRIVMSA